MRASAFFRAPAALVAVLLLALAPADADAFMHSDRKRELAALARETWLHAYKSYKRASGSS